MGLKSIGFASWILGSEFFFARYETNSSAIMYFWKYKIGFIAGRVLVQLTFLLYFINVICSVVIKCFSNLIGLKSIRFRRRFCDLVRIFDLMSVCFYLRVVWICSIWQISQTFLIIGPYRSINWTPKCINVNALIWSRKKRKLNLIDFLFFTRNSIQKESIG